MSGKYDHLNREELSRLLEARDQRDSTRLGLVWEANEVDRDRALNWDFVALDLVPEASAGPAGPWRNLIVEGDNFDALRYLRMTFGGRVKCILIDPPYNTGNKDFIYNDRFVDENNAWRFSTWLEFLYQRLVIARDLLREDGGLLCCINDENRAKLELLLDKVFPGRRIGSFVWRTKDSANDAGGNMSQVHEHVLVYANRNFAFGGKKLKLDDYRNPDNDRRGPWTPQPLTKAETYKTRANTYYPIQDPKTGYWYPCDPDRVWAYGCVPEGLNEWELAFVEFLDRDLSKTIRWWHRNPVNKPWSVRVLLPDGRGFFPDFVIGVEGRKKGEGILLADPKFRFETDDEAPKALAEHIIYGRVLILSLTGEKRWAVVKYDLTRGRPVLGPEFSIGDAAGF